MVMDPNNPESAVDFDELIMFPNSDHRQFPPSSAVDWHNDLHFINSFNPPDNLDLAFSLSPGGESFVFSSTSDSPASDPSSGWSPEHHNQHQEDESSSDPVTKYISQMLMEENMENKPYLCYDPLALRATEMSLYSAIGEQYPASAAVDSPFSLDVSDYSIGNSSFPDWDSLSPDSNPTEPESDPMVKGIGSDSNPNRTGWRPESDPVDMVKNMFSNEDSVLQFNKGLEEARKFLPIAPNLTLADDGGGRAEGNVDRREKPTRKNSHERESSDLEEEEQRNKKQSAISYEEEGELSEMFDKVLLLPEGATMCAAIDQYSYNAAANTVVANDAAVNGGGGRGGKKQGKSKTAKKVNAAAKKNNETADLRGLLVLCAQAVSSSDFRTANELLKQVRQHSSETGDGTQRLAHYFANGLEARLVGNSSMAPNFFYSIASVRISAADILKAYRTHLNSCPFKKMSILFANKMIYETALDATTLHVIDFGVMFGFQWPILIQLLAMRPGGPPRLRITGVELPQRGFRPTERIEETGRRLAKYCERFKIPFEYNPIASQNWEAIGLEEFKIRKGKEVVAVNSLSRLKNLMEESFDANSPRNAVMELIRRMEPDIFVQTEINGAYNAPFFVTRFREALFHFSSLFDMFECTLGGKEEKERLMFEREIYGREAMNVVAAEGAERVERPETYKQWQVRNVRAGFKSLPLRKDLMEKVRSKMKLWYHKDFVVDQDGNWMLQGWKGRIICATSCWVPA